MGSLAFVRTSYTATVPSYMPATNRAVCTGWKSRHMTPESVTNLYSGYAVFFSV